MRNDNLKTFDDNDLLKSAKCFHIEKLMIYFGEYINGISVTYKLDGRLRTVDHIGNCEPSPTVEKLMVE
jgi:hypothetical protein